VIQGEIRYEVA